jgi:hypothetical protein
VAGKAGYRRNLCASSEIFSTLGEDNGRYILEGLCRDTVIITNLGSGEAIDDQLRKINQHQWLEADIITTPHHQRSTDQLTTRALKTFG